jgi:hypothetical protein
MPATSRTIPAALASVTQRIAFIPAPPFRVARRALFPEFAR